MGDVQDANWAKKEIGKAVKHFEVNNQGHLTFMVGKDMSYFNRVLKLV
jgi:hypothetical protein